MAGADIKLLSYQYFKGIDLVAIESVNEGLTMAIIAKLGLEGIRKFPTAQQFTAWLRLAPNNKISGGKVRYHHIRKGNSRLKTAFRNTAKPLEISKKVGWLISSKESTIKKEE